MANIWWAHHKFLSTLGSLEPELIALTLVLLGAVALVPFPTNLIGHVPTERAAVLPFIGVFVVILVLFRGRDASRPGFQRENRKEMEDMVTVALVVVAVALTGIGFFGLYRPWQLRWGATPG